MSTRLDKWFDTGLPSLPYEDYPEYYNIISNWINNQKSPAVGINTIENVFPSVASAFNTFNTYYMKFITEYELGPSLNGWFGRTIFYPFFSMDNKKIRMYIWHENSATYGNYYQIRLGTTETSSANRRWQGSLFNDSGIITSAVDGDVNDFPNAYCSFISDGINDLYRNSQIRKTDDYFYGEGIWQPITGTNDCYRYDISVALQYFDPNTQIYETNIPIFDQLTVSDLEAYIKTGVVPEYGDITKTTHFTLWIDGLNYPQYHLNWHNDAENQPNFDYGNYTITLECRSLNSAFFSDPLVIQTDYGSGSLDFSWENIKASDAFSTFFGSDSSRVSMKCDYIIDGKSVSSDTVYVTLLNNQASFSAMYKDIVNGADGSDLVVRQGVPSEDDDYVPPTDEDDDPNPDDTDVLETSGALTACFNITKNHLKSLGDFLYSNTFIDNIKLVNNNPIENIISVKAIPFTPTSLGAESSIKLGNVDTNISATRCQEAVRVNIGSFVVNKHYNSFLDFAPYTSVSLFLPFIGIVNIDHNFIIGKSIAIDYIVDCITGSLKVQLIRDGKAIYEFNGNCGADIPISGMNRAQVEMGILSSLGGGIAGVAFGSPMSATYSFLSTANSQYHTTTNGSASSNTSFHMRNRCCYLIIDRPVADSISSYAKTHGKMCNLTLKLGDLHGMTKCNKDVRLDGIYCTDTEKEMIRTLLTNGVIF